MSGSPSRNVVVVVQLWPAEKVGQHVVVSWPVLGADGEVVTQRDAVQLAQQASESSAACRLSVNDVYIGTVIHVE
jgi:hypothetical protein